MKIDTLTDSSRRDLNWLLLRLNGIRLSDSHCFTQISMVSFRELLVNSDLTSKLARYTGEEKLKLRSSLLKSIEFLTVKRFCVNGDKIGKKNFARL